MQFRHPIILIKMCIRDRSTPEEMQIAHEMRMKHGKHVIPVPTFEVKKQFSGYFVEPMVQFFKRKNHNIAEEKTVMRPTYSYLGDYKISQRAIIDICTYEASRFASMYKLLRVKSSTTKGNRIVLDLELSLRYPCRIEAEANRIAENIKNSIEEHTSINVKYVNICLLYTSINHTPASSPYSKKRLTCVRRFVAA